MINKIKDIRVWLYAWMCIQLFVNIFALNKGASNTDEFSGLLQARWQAHLLPFDIFNLLSVLHGFFFKKITIVSFRETKLLLSLFTFIYCAFIFVPLLQKKYNLSKVRVAFIHCTL